MSGLAVVRGFLRSGAFSISSRRSLFLIILLILLTTGVLNALLSQLDVSVGEV